MPGLQLKVSDSSCTELDAASRSRSRCVLSFSGVDPASSLYVFITIPCQSEDLSRADRMASSVALVPFQWEVSTIVRSRVNNSIDFLRA